VILDLGGVASGAATPDRSRLERELAEAEVLLSATQARLANPQFLERAPAAVVDGTRARAGELEDVVTRLRGSLGR
jgi:valyl-tRNA synthetase